MHGPRRQIRRGKRTERCCEVQRCGRDVRICSTVACTQEATWQKRQAGSACSGSQAHPGQQPLVKVPGHCNTCCFASPWLHLYCASLQHARWSTLPTNRDVCQTRGLLPIQPPDRAEMSLSAPRTAPPQHLAPFSSTSTQTRPHDGADLHLASYKTCM
jgi:hypothetical protein